MATKPDPELPARLSSDLRKLLENISDEYTLRLSDGTIEVNKTYLKLKNAEVKISKNGISIVKGKIDDCITSW